MGIVIHGVSPDWGNTDYAAIRRSLAKSIDAMIELLDLLDGDPDLEDDDPAGGAVDDLGEPDLSEDLPLPRWGIDQSRGPINEDVVRQSWWLDETTGTAFVQERMRGHDL